MHKAGVTTRRADFDIDPVYGMDDTFVDWFPQFPVAGVRGEASMPYPVYGWLHLYWGSAEGQVKPGGGGIPQREQ